VLIQTVGDTRLGPQISKDLEVDLDISEYKLHKRSSLCHICLFNSRQEQCSDK